MDKYLEERPWGKFEQFCHNEKVTVKIITVRPHSKLSLQYHRNRDEFWRVIEGKGEVVLGEKTLKAERNDEFFIPKETEHRMMTQDKTLEIMEISFGDFDENDIVRIDDIYQRKQLRNL